MTTAMATAITTAIANEITTESGVLLGVWMLFVGGVGVGGKVLLLMGRCCCL